MSKNLVSQMQDTMGGHHFFFENYSLCVPESEHTVAAKQHSISTSIHLPEHSRLRQPSNAWFQSMLVEFYPAQATPSDTPKNVSPKEANLGMVLESGREEGRGGTMNLCHLSLQISPGKLPFGSQERNKHCSESLTKGQIHVHIHG